MSVYDFSVATIDGQETTLEQYKGDVLLIVNTASHCGLTPHYAGLQKLYETYGERGLTVLGFPCNQFAGQEPGSEAEIKQFCETHYGVTFPMFAKVDVKGPNAHPLFEYLVAHAPEPDRTGEIEWNFVKFLIDRSGNIVRQYSARTEPAEITKDIEQLL